MAGPWVQLPPQQRVVLALLVADRGRVCRADRMVQALWGEAAPKAARRRLQGLVSRLRAVLEAGETRRRLRTVPGGWSLDLDGDSVDVARFEGLVRTGGELLARGRSQAAGPRLEEALALWRGPPFGELADHPALVADTTRLEEQHLTARESLLSLRLEAGDHTRTVAELWALALAHPLRERLWGLLMQALYHSGRPADALAAYRQLRERLMAELGAEPGREVRGLHAAILRQELPAPAPRQQLADGGPSGRPERARSGAAGSPVHDSRPR